MDEARVCLFTGAAGRLGSAFCASTSERYRFVGAYRTPTSAIPRQAGEAGRRSSLWIQVDLRKADERERLVDLALAEFGRIDVLINSAVHSVWAPMLDTHRVVDSAQEQFETNVIVPLQLAVLCARKFWSHRKTSNLQLNRNVINVSSIAGSKVYSGQGQSVYAASKAALDHLSRHMACEFSEIGVRVNAVAPNSFPRIVPTARVVETLKLLDQGTMNGQVLMLDREVQDSGFR